MSTESLELSSIIDSMLTVRLHASRKRLKSPPRVQAKSFKSPQRLKHEASDPWRVLVTHALLPLCGIVCVRTDRSPALKRGKREENY
eukprot:767748-Pelagomonas_calceolata.AAC.1